MMRRVLLIGCAWGCGLAVALVSLDSATAAPRITNVSLRGLQAGGVTTLMIEGDELLPEPRVMLSVPVAKLSIKEGATAKRMEVEFALDGQTAGGIYLLRVASASGISESTAVAVDNLSQIAFAPQLPTLNVAMTGALEGSAVLTTSFAGKQGQRVLIEVESRRLGSKLDPVIHLYDARRVQLTWSRGVASISGDARCAATLPSDGQYTIEIHDSLYRGDRPGFFRLKAGEFHYADLVYPLAAQQGVTTNFEFASTNLAAGVLASATWSNVDGPPQIFQPAPWPAGVSLLCGSRPPVIVSNHAEILEPPPGDKLPELSATPVAVNGRISEKGQQDRYRLAVSPGQKLRFDVLARRAGSPLDGVLSIQNEQGAELAGNDDRPGTSDPGLDFTVPDGVGAVVVALRDLQGRGGAEFIYRIDVAPIGPDFSLSLDDSLYNVPKDGVELVSVKIDRAGYNGPVKLHFRNLPTSVSITGDEIPAGATEAFVTLSAPGLSAAQAMTTVVGSSTEPNTSIRRSALGPANAVNKHQPWLRDEVALAVAGPSPISLVWDLFSAETKFAVGTTLPIKLRVARAAETAGPVRLKLLTTQVMPRKRVKVTGQPDREVDDTERAIRLEASTIAPDKNEDEGKIVIPADLPRIAYDVAIKAELLSADKKTVLATAVTPARRMAAAAPMSVELAAGGPLEARAGLGPTGKLAGKVHRVSGFDLAVNLTLAGLPKGVTPPSFVVAADKTDFAFDVAFPYGTPPGDLSGVQLVATSQSDPKKPITLVRANEIPLAIKVVPGEKPPVEKPLTIFEDQAEFVASLNEGGGQASLLSEEKFSGAASVKVTPDQRFNPALPGLGVKIREKPAAGEFRYLQFAWKKQGGQAICLQLNHDGQWGPVAGSPAKFRYHAGPGGECFGASLAVDSNLPVGFTLVTRDLFADFGEFTLNGIALSPVDGEFALFDHIYLAPSPESFDLVKP